MTLDDDGGNGWSEHKRLVEHQLDEHGKRIGGLEEDVDRLRVTIDRLPGRVAIGILTIFLGAASSAFTTWMLRDRPDEVKAAVERLADEIRQERIKRSLEVGR